MPTLPATAPIDTPPLRRKDVWGWVFYDVGNHGYATTILAVIFNRYYALQVAGGETGIAMDWFGLQFSIPGATLFTYFVSISTFIVMLFSPVTGAMADHTQRKKSFLMFSTVIGVACTAMLWFVGKGDWLFGGIVFALANLGFNAGLAFYDAILKDIAKPEETGWISGFGWGIGYFGGGILLLINMIMLQPPKILGIQPFQVQDTFAAVAIWWFLFSIPMILWVKEPAISIKSGLQGIGSDSFRRLKRTLKDARKLPDLLRFLLAFFFFNNGVQTVILMAAIFGEAELKMNSSSLILFFLMIQFCGFAGSLTLGKLSDKIGDKTVLLITLVIWCIVCIWSCLLGLFTDPVTEFWMVGILAGLILGASQSSARSLFARFTPVSRAAEFFGFYSVQARLSTLLGPMVYGTMLWITGSIRYAILCLLVFFVVGGVLLLKVNVSRGNKQALEAEFE